ncbi:MAG: hypothetical protein RIE32_01605 [Phycisphaerales bacterium]
MARRRPSVASVHADWLHLIETSGPFLSLPVLVDALGHGLDAVETDAKQRLRNAYEEWSVDPTGGHAEWLGIVIRELLEHEDRYVSSFADWKDVPKTLRHHVDEHAEMLWPQLVIHESGELDERTSRLLVCIHPRSQKLEKGVAGSRWAASPQSRMAELCRATGVRLGLVTNGEQWCLVDAPRDETVGYATWYAQLWLDEPNTFAAFRSLLGRHRFFAVGEDETLESLLTRSRENQHEVTDQLGLQVRRAVEMLVRTLDRADQDLGGELLKELEVGEIYEAAVTVMMRLVFLFSAEERGLLLLGDPVFDEYYAVSTLCEQLREVAEQHGEEVLERRRDAWCRLLAAFRAVHSGVHHDRLQIPAYGGGLFDPDRFPFLEGRPKGTTWQDSDADPLPVDNRTVLHCLESLQYLQTKIGQQVESRRLSFRALDIEQIGHVYEGLLDHTAVRANGPTLGLYGKDGDEPEVELEELESLASQSRAKLVERLAKLKIKSSKKSVEKLLDSELDAVRVDQIRRACGSDELWGRVEPFASLVRDDDFGQPIIIHEGQLFATQGQDRSDTGTQYTPRSLTEPVVEHSLEPLVYIGPAEGKPREEWQLLTPKEILDLKVCDMACGSGAFLVQACRYLGDRLVESWAIAETKVAGPNPGKLTFSTIHYDGSKGSGERDLVPKDEDERLLTARRLIAQRCIYGVDINPVAAEMAKLSIWLLTLSKDKPFSFLDHAIRSGDALLGLHDIRQLQRFSLDPESAVQTTFSNMSITELIEQASGTRLQIEQLDSDTIGHVQAQARLLGEADARTERLRFAADMLISGYIQPASNAGEREDQLRHATVKAGQLTLSGSSEDMHEYAQRALLGKRPFHWCLEFPEILSRGGFDAVIGNPPFKGGQKLTGIFGTAYREYLVDHLANGQRGSADLVAYFFLRMASLLRTGGHFGLIATNTIAQGDTREVGLDQLGAELHPDRIQLMRGVSSRPWPGGASLEVAHVYGRSIRATEEIWRGPYFIDDKPAEGVTSFLTPPGRVVGKPYRLKANEGKSFQGSIVLGMGFVMTPEEAQQLIEKDPKNAEVLMPYLNGQDLNSRPDQSPSRWVINFRDWPLKREVLMLPGGGKASWVLADDKQRKAWLRTGIVPQDYTDPVAADFPECLRVVEETVKPERENNNRDVYRERWWQYAEKRPDLYATIADMARVLMCSQTGRRWSPAWVPLGIVYSHTSVLFADSTWEFFGAMQAVTHEEWRLEYGPSLRMDARYTPSDCFETFPFPKLTPDVAVRGEALYLGRQAYMTTQNIGLTSLANLLHNKSVEEVASLREAYAALDVAVVAAYGWGDLIDKLRHGFYPTEQGERFTIHPDARAEILARLLALNHQRYKEEVEAGLHDKKSNSKAKKKSAKRTSKKDKVAGESGLFKGSAT